MSGRKNTLIKHKADTIQYLDYIPVVSKRGNVISSKTEKFIKVNLPKKSCRQWYLGKLLMGSIDNTFRGRFKPVKISFKFKGDNPKEEDQFDKIIVLFDSDPVIVTNYINNARFIKEVMSLKKEMSFDFSCRDDNLYLKIYFTQLPLPVFYRKLGICLKNLFIQLFGPICSNYDDFENTSKIFHGDSEVQKLYDKLTEKRKTDKIDYNVEENVQHHDLKPKLRPYQQESVKWMLYRERMEDSKTDFLHPLYIPIKLRSNLVIYFDKYTGFVCNEKPITTLSTKIGILADEMGLGKTVEVLACILLNPKVEPKENKTDHSKKRKNTDESEGPIIEIPQKKSKKLKKPKEPFYVEKPREVQEIKPRVQATKSKKVKVRTEKRQTYVASNRLNNNILTDTSNIQPKQFEQVDKIYIQCVCGSTSMTTAIRCSSCNIYQHRECLGYKKSLGKYFCPQCWINQPLVESKATLVVTPAALKTQWCEEIAKHLKGNLRVLQYQGHSINSVYPTELKEYDIVLTTYTVLQRELKLTQAEEAKNLRQEKKYCKPGCPLTRIKWWRLCLDEAQTVDTYVNKVSLMAGKIEAVHRWAVTGTPISKNISDLYGLIDYLHVSPYNDPTTWQKILYQPYLVGNEEPLLNFLSTILWRTSKKDVADQVDIPKQTYLYHTLDFCAVEKYFYKREHEIRGRFFAERCNRYDPAICLDTFDKKALKNILEPVLTLRQMCVTTTTPKGTFLTSRKEVKSMKDLLDALILTSTNDTEECLRLVISAYNGMAGIHLLLQDPQEAINTYREVLQLIAKFSEENSKIRVNVDKPQVIHTLHNLAEVLEFHPPEYISLRDIRLRNECEEVETKYLEKFISESYAVFMNVQSLTLDIENLQERLLLKDCQWYTDGLKWIILSGLSKKLRSNVRTACNAVGILNEDRNISDGTLRQFLYNWDNALMTLREESFTAVSNLYGYKPDSIHKIVITRSLVNKAMNCHLRPQKKSKECPMCVSDKCLKKYELKLFNMTERKEMFEKMSLKGAWKSTYPEIVMQSLHSTLKLQNANQELIKDGGIQINMINTMKKEFKELRKFWTYLDRQICAMDELDICKVRLQLKPEEEEKERCNNILKNLTYELQNKHDTIHLLSVHELDYQLMLLQNEVSDNTRKFEQLLAKQSYLETLRKQQYEGQNPDPCPICRNQLEQHWSILPCGHCYCLDCIYVILEEVSEDFISCSVCRSRQLYHEVSYINAGDTVKDNSIQIKGSYSTKISQIVKVLLELKEEDKDVKVLLFSSWAKVLGTVKQALDENDISCELLQSRSISNFDIKIASFKDPAKDIMVLLLPVALGSKGLNLIEANHVMFAEPLLNPADELQAIGRIDRIGQTRNTFVHKFLMKNTIEENIHQATTSNAQNWERNAVTIQRMLDLFKVPE